MVERERLAGRWVHSHEEDSGDELVFRPAGYAFPPSRGREAIELHPDGSYAGSVPGPVDKPEATEGEWTLEDDGGCGSATGCSRSPRRPATCSRSAALEVAADPREDLAEALRDALQDGVLGLADGVEQRQRRLRRHRRVARARARVDVVVLGRVGRDARVERAAAGVLEREGVGARRHAVLVA